MSDHIHDFGDGRDNWTCSLGVAEASLLAESAGKWLGLSNGQCPRCHEVKFLGHGPLCPECYDSVV
jgi:hypothetical protein